MSIISKEILKKNIPFLDILYSIEKEYNCKIYLVGGCLRDIILNIQLSDIDITACNIDYINLAKILGKKIKAYPVSFKDNMRLMKNNLIIDVSKLRGQNIYDDVLKRDFTINNLACSLDGEIIGDVSDINNKIIKIVTDNSFIDDPLRIIRAFRFASTLSFTIDDYTMQNICKNKELIKSSAKERILEEFRKMFKGENLSYALDLLEKHNVLSPILDYSYTDNNKLIAAKTKTSEFHLLLYIWTKDMNFINFLNLQVQEMKNISVYSKLDYNKLKNLSEKELLFFAFKNAKLIDNIALFIKFNFEDITLSNNILSCFHSLDFSKTKAVNGALLQKLGFSPSPLFTTILEETSFLLAIGELNSDNVCDYITNKWRQQ